jgi:hypothetical protein
MSNFLLDTSVSPAAKIVPVGIGGVQKVADVAVHPGEDSTRDRTWGGWRASGSYISSATTTTVKSGAGTLHTIVVGETAAGAITIYDNTAASGTTIMVLKSSIVEGTYVFDRDFSTGLTIVTAAASKIHVSYI